MIVITKSRFIVKVKILLSLLLLLLIFYKHFKPHFKKKTRCNSNNIVVLIAKVFLSETIRPNMFGPR